jgi:hypothetical protein
MGRLAFPRSGWFAAQMEIHDIRVIIFYSISCFSKLIGKLVHEFRRGRFSRSKKINYVFYRSARRLRSAGQSSMLVHLTD